MSRTHEHGESTEEHESSTVEDTGRHPPKEGEDIPIKPTVEGRNSGHRWSVGKDVPADHTVEGI